LIRLGRASSRETTESCLSRLRAVNPAINAVVRVLEEEALTAAVAADEAQARGEARGPLHGVPVTTKVNTDQAGCPTDNGVVAFRDAIATQDAPVVANLRWAGAVIIGRTNTPAFSMRAFADNALHGRTLNPRDPALSAGGSSGGCRHRDRPDRARHRYWRLGPHPGLVQRCPWPARLARPHTLV
jgi:amidase